MGEGAFQVLAQHGPRQEGGLVLWLLQGASCNDCLLLLRAPLWNRLGHQLRWTEAPGFLGAWVIIVKGAQLDGGGGDGEPGFEVGEVGSDEGGQEG